jgi:predicted Na+-dependent transporter
LVSSDFCQLFYPSILSFTLSKLIFTDTSMPCNMVMDLSRLGLFLLGTAPSNTAATYFSALWNGDLNLSVGLVILSTIVSPLSTLFWWATLGKVLLSSSQTDILTVPALLILEFLGVMVVPVFIGIGLAGIFPCIKGFMQWIRRPVLVVGMLLYIGIYYYQYNNFLDIFSTSHLAACASLALGSALLSCITALFCNLNTSQIISIVIDCTMQNASLSYAVVAGSLKEPEVQYASSPANAQVLFTSIPIMVAWFINYGGGS